MAREPKVTRTFATYKVTVLCANELNGLLEENIYTFPRPMTQKKIIASLVDQLAGTNITPIKVKETEIVNTRYEMTESDFLKFATVKEN